MQDWLENAFLEVDSPYAGLNEARFVVLPIAYDGTSTYKKGSRFGPDAIIEASRHLEEFDEQLLDEYHRAGIHTHRHVICEEPTAEKVQEQIYITAQRLADQGKTIISLGGEHSITAPLVKAVHETRPGLSVLHFDAHADLRDSYEGSAYNHACVMRRIHDLGLRSVSVGIRSYSRSEYDFINANGITIFSAAKVSRELPEVKQAILKRLSSQVYVTFDIDVLDPGVAPGTGTPEPGGLSYVEVLAILETVGRNKQIVAADVVEVRPIPGNHITEYTAARLVYKIISFAQLNGD